MVYAQKCADENSAHKRSHYAFLETEQTERKMGQCIYFGGGPAENAVIHWYSENEKYDFDKPGPQAATGHFTALVWYDTTHVGMARSACGQYLVANYFPAGNWDNSDCFAKNVLPMKAQYTWRPRNGFEQRLARHFRKIAKDEDGMQVPLVQLFEYLQALGEHRLAEALQEADADHDGNIHAGEFIAAACTLRHSDESASKEIEQNMRRIVGFVSFDQNGDGLLDERELLHYLNKTSNRVFSETEVKNLMGRFDTDRNGCLDYKEIVALCDSGLLQSLEESVLLERWDRRAEALMAGVPQKDIVHMLRTHVQSGGKARVTKTDQRVIVKLIFEGPTGGKRFTTLQGEWGDKALPPEKQKRTR